MKFVDSDEAAIRGLLSRIDCLDEIERRVGGANIFDVLGMARAEIRHSNVLSWLLDPRGTHGLGTLFLRTFLQSVVAAGGDAIRLLASDLDSFVVLREYKHIDLLLVSRESKVVVAIENKVDSSEHDNQLARYEETVSKDFADFHRTYVFLTPDGQEASRENWHGVTYGDIHKAVGYCRGQVCLSVEAELMVDQYKKLLEREFMDKNELSEICNKIYREHKRALDLIFEYREDRASVHKDMIDKWFKAHPDCGIDYCADRSGKTLIRFSTPWLDRLVPPHRDGLTSGWGSERNAYYEIVNQSGRIGFKLVASSVNLDPRVEGRLRRIPGAKTFSLGWKWKTIHQFPNLWKSPDNDSDVTLDDESLEAMMKRIVEEVKKFEKLALD